MSEPNNIQSRIAAYLVALVGEFASTYSLNNKQAYRYLELHKGIDFAIDFYDVEHTLPFPDAVNDVAQYCRNNGGQL